MVKEETGGCVTTSRLTQGFKWVLPQMWSCLQRHPPPPFGRVHWAGGGRMTLLLRHSSGARALGAEFPMMGHTSSVVCSILLRGCMCCTMELVTESHGADSRRSAQPHSVMGHCVETRPPFWKQFSCASSSPGLLSWLWLIGMSLHCLTQEALRCLEDSPNVFELCILVLEFFFWSQAGPSCSAFADFLFLHGTENEVEERLKLSSFPCPSKMFSRKENVSVPLGIGLILIALQGLNTIS